MDYCSHSSLLLLKPLPGAHQWRRMARELFYCNP